MNAFKWVEEITKVSNVRLEPVDGEWGRFYAGSLEKGKNCIGIPLANNQAYQVETGLLKSRSVQLDEVGTSFIIEWNQGSDHELALLFIDDLLSTKGFLKAPIEIFKKKQDVWKEFEEDDPASRMLNKLIGLWGELAFVTTYPEACPYWTGPSSTDLDFKFEDALMDMKTTRKKNADELTVSGLWQLSGDGHPLYITLYRVESSSKVGRSLYDLLSIVDKNHIQSTVLEDLEAMVEKLGDKLCNIKLALREKKVYPVNKRFPQLTKNILKDCMPETTIDRIKKLTYTVSLSGLKTISEEEFINNNHLI